MARFLKDLKVTDSQEGKVMTTDSEGRLISSDKNVADLASTTETGALDTRVTALEGAVGDIGQRLANING